MSHHPSVSVILPVYNGRDYLQESIESVLGQTFTNFELLIWDDASTDDSWDIVRDYRDSRVRLHRNTANFGLFPNINLALEASRGALVRLWAQDDRMKPECLEKERAFQRTHPAVGFFYCQRDIIDHAGRIVGPASLDPTPDVVPSRLADEISFNWGSMPGNISTVTIPRRVLREVGPFDATMTLAADFDLWVRIQQHYHVGFCREPLIELRRHEKQLSRRAGAELVFLRECSEIYRRLHERLPEGTRARRERYSRTVHCSHYVNAALRALVGGEPSYAARLASEIHRWHHLGVVIPLWMITGNLRFYHPKPVYSADLPTS